MQYPPRKGRPILPPDERLMPHTLRLTPRQIATIEHYGKGWLQAMLDTHRPPEKVIARDVQALKKKSDDYARSQRALYKERKSCPDAA